MLVNIGMNLLGLGMTLDELYGKRMTPDESYDKRIWAKKLIFLLAEYVGYIIELYA